MASGLAVYASSRRSPDVGRKTRSQPLVRRYWTGFPPAGFLRKVSNLFPYISSPFPKLLGAIPVSSSQILDEPDSP